MRHPAAAGELLASVSAAISAGTPMKAPGMPQRKAPRKTATSTRKGDIASRAPASRGSIVLPDRNWMPCSARKTMTADCQVPNCSTAKMVGNSVASSEPMKGM